MFTGNWTTQGDCVTDANECMVGLNYASSVGECADSARGWSNGTNASCGFLMMKCARTSIDYDPEHLVVVPRNSFVDGERFDRYTYVAKKWVQCTSNSIKYVPNPSNTTKFPTPGSLTCTVAKRCYPFKCQRGAGKKKGEKKCRLLPFPDNIPGAVEARAAIKCAQH